MKATIQYIRSELTGLYPVQEIEGFIRIIFEWICGWDFTTQILYNDRIINAEEFEKIKLVIRRLKNFEPIQYIKGEAEFYGLKIKVSPSVLIPRPETEELADWVIKSKIPANAKILDIATGSGCIALALKKHLKNVLVYATDVSENALEIAKNNALINGLDVVFFQTDILNYLQYSWDIYDVIVSNPPYVRESEKRQMQLNVLEHEPSIALFVSDDDPLVFYRAIVKMANTQLTAGGYLFLEINENLGTETSRLLTDSGFWDVKVKKDINGKDRMVVCRK